MTSERFSKTVDDWAEILCDVIPEEKLYPSFLSAYRNRTPGYAMECAALIQAYRREVEISSSTSFLSRQNCTLCQAYTAARFGITEGEEINIPPCPFHQAEAIGEGEVK